MFKITFAGFNNNKGKYQKMYEKTIALKNPAPQEITFMCYTLLSLTNTNKDTEYRSNGIL